MTRNDILILALHAVFLAIWFLDSKSIDWWKMHLKYRKMIKKMDYQTRELGDIRIHESQHSNKMIIDHGFGIEQKSHKNNSHIRGEWNNRSKNHPAGRQRPGTEDSGMYQASPDGWRRKAWRQYRKKSEKSIFVNMNELFGRDDFRK